MLVGAEEGSGAAADVWTVGRPENVCMCVCVCKWGRVGIRPCPCVGARGYRDERLKTKVAPTRLGRPDGPQQPRPPISAVANFYYFLAPPPPSTTALLENTGRDRIRTVALLLLQCAMRAAAQGP